MLCQISKDLLIQQNDCYTNYHIVILTISKKGMCWFNTSFKMLVNKLFVGSTNLFLQCGIVHCIRIEGGSVEHSENIFHYFNKNLVTLAF